MAKTVEYHNGGWENAKKSKQLIGNKNEFSDKNEVFLSQHSYTTNNLGQMVHRLTDKQTETVTLPVT